MRETLIKVYLDWRNNYLSMATFADHNGLTISEAENLIALARQVFDHPHPDE